MYKAYEMLHRVAEHHVGKRFSPDAEQVMDMMVSLTLTAQPVKHRASEYTC